MTLLLLYIIAICFNNSLQDCVIDNRIPEDAWEQQIQKDLKLKSLESPSAVNSSEIEVHLRFMMKYFEFDSNEQMFRVFSWVHLKWYNDKMTWNPADYGGVTETVLMSMDMWIPTVRLLNGLSLEGLQHIFNVPCDVKSDGFVTCVPRFDDIVICSTVLTNWPYDTQTCSLEFGGLCSQDSLKIRLSFNDRAITMIGAEYGAEWDIMDYKQEENQDANVQLRMTFVLERHADGLAAILVYPSTILTILSITSLIIDVRIGIRLWLICFNLVNHFTFLSEIQEDLPKNSFTVPILLFYYRGSIIVTTLIVLMSIVLNKICRIQAESPAWITSVNDFVFKSQLRWAVWPRWYCESNVPKYTEFWTNFANLINSVCLFTTIITYICLYFVYMPQPPPINY